ncbi:MAG: hypothetical protein GKR89_17325 [Candidatus Latescibacteria bacterium]|nr:hypothetical protein [Candidatus Latescibacterota bacterium]
MDRDDRMVPAVWIAAFTEAAGRRLWGMTPVERQVRQLALLDARRFCVWTTPQLAPRTADLRPDFQRLYSGVEVEFVETAGLEGLAAGLEQAGEDLLVLEGAVVYDDRILEHLLECGPGTWVRGDAGTLALYLDGPRAAVLGRGRSQNLAGLVQGQAAALDLTFFAPDQVEQYVAELRLTMEPHMLRLPASGSLRPIERAMYRRTFKGVIDIVASHGYYHPVRWITRHISPTRITPNALTVLSIVGIWAAVPCFAAGELGWGALAAWMGVLLDSVDGKLARLRLHLSQAMGDIEHLTAMPGLGLWFVAWGWYLSGGQLLGGGVAWLTWVLVGAFLIDKGLSGGFKARFGRELFDYTRIDALVHPFAARRNIALVLFTLGWASGQPLGALVLLTGWMVVTLGFHALRWVWIAARHGRESS